MKSVSKDCATRILGPLAVAVLLTLGSPTAFSQTTSSASTKTRVVKVAQSAEQLAAKIEEYMKAAVKVEYFSGAILVARDGRPIVSKGYGMANYELNVPNTPQTAFRLASITKQFSAAAIMQLQERGKLSVTDPICKYLDNCPAAWQPITIRHLLTHTSGIPNYTLFPGFFETTAVQSHTFTGFVDVFRDKRLDFAPGERFAYSNSGYYLLGLIIERALGVPYADFLHDNIFVPWEMKNSGYDDSETLVPNRANGYRWNGKSFANAPYWSTSILFSAGGPYSTTEDLLRWERSLTTERMLSKKSLDEIFTPFKSGFGSPFTEDGYGYGWGIRKSGQRQSIYHSGGVSGAVTYIARFPFERVTVIVLSNNGNVSTGRIARAIVDRFR
jgi:CubicO group peptidase (beta-lactamase class C family)